MNIEIKWLISTAAQFRKTSVAEIARSINMAPQNLYRKMKKGNLKPEELSRIAKKLGGEIVIYFSFPNGSKIGNMDKSIHTGKDRTQKTNPGSFSETSIFGKGQF